MNAIFFFASMLFLQEASAAGAAAPAAATKMIDVRVQLIGLKDGFEIPDELPDPAGFLKDARTQENMIWSRDIRVSAIEGTQVLMNTGENVPMITGYSVTAQGRTNPHLSRQQTGTIVQLTPRLEGDGRILLRLNIENSRLDRGDSDAAATETEQANDALLSQTIRQMSFDSNVVVLNGRTKSFSLSQSSASRKQTAEQALILITARVVDE